MTSDDRHASAPASPPPAPPTRACAWRCTANVVEAIRAELGSPEAVTAVVKITVFVASAPGFIEQHLVADPASAYLKHVFGDEIGQHSRSAIGVAELPTGSPVEVEALVRVAG